MSSTTRQATATATAPGNSTGKATSKQTLAKVLSVIGRQMPLLVASVVLAAATVVAQLYIPVLFGDAIDQMTAAHHVRFDVLKQLLWRAGVLIAGSSALTWLMNLINNRLAYHTVAYIRARAIRQIQMLPLSYLDAHSAGDVVQRVIADTDQLADGLLLGFTQLFSGVATIAVTLWFMAAKDLGITGLVLVLTPLSFVVARFIANRSYDLFGRQTATRGRQTALVNELVGNQKVVVAFGHGREASAQFERINEELRGYSQGAVFFSSLTNPSTRAVNNLIYALVALVGAWRVFSGGLSVGGLTVMLSYANQYMKPFNDISSVVTELQNALACAARVFELIEATPEPNDAARELVCNEGAVSIENVSFAYTPDKPLIEGFCLQAKPGTKTAIVGPTGCGKTTFINLLMRFYDVDGGSIAVDGQDIADVSRASLRRSFGMVLQETWLKAATVRENIAFGAPEATDEQIEAAAREAHSWEFIRRLPQGLDTVISDDSLSAGQKQLLCITRVMLCLPPMLILDEATSSIDTRTELQVQQAFDKLMRGRTSFVVAHRLSTIREADQIVVMRDGHIVEIGDHEGLLARGGFYAELYNAQFAGTEQA